MTQKHEAETRLHARDDAEILNDIILVCREGETLYSHVATQVQDQQSRNLFVNMAEVRLKIAQELEAEAAVRGVELSNSGCQIDNIRRWYTEARHRFSQYHDKEFIAQLDETEKKSLAVLRTAVSKVTDKALAFRLSSLVASFQIVHDRMQKYKESYR